MTTFTITSDGVLDDEGRELSPDAIRRLQNRLADVEQRIRHAATRRTFPRGARVRGRHGASVHTVVGHTPAGLGGAYLRVEAPDGMVMLVLADEAELVGDPTGEGDEGR
ncbi:hypothetical protein HDA32_000015 [Spinactinospora alkalitolerans]|uniref:Uncharacterized protein n=1 Tax=Spinactinospora alkalitolerans TaxID=687207 RepID=A0A852TMT7_9ACTN|nr:hypothetical protein [Spinactinospora alkalitolerans]NYE44895.1 hypothetical protein [Spinactinospora alkalitolerans]